MFGNYYDSFDCEVTPEELEGFEEWNELMNELDEEEMICGNLAEILLINEEDIPF